MTASADASASGKTSFRSASRNSQPSVSPPPHALQSRSGRVQADALLEPAGQSTQQMAGAAAEIDDALALAKNRDQIGNRHVQSPLCVRDK